MVALMELILFGCWLWPRFEFGAVGIFTDVLVSLLLYAGKIQSVVFSRWIDGSKDEEVGKEPAERSGCPQR